MRLRMSCIGVEFSSDDEFDRLLRACCGCFDRGLASRRGTIRLHVLVFVHARIPVSPHASSGLMGMRFV